MNDMPLQRGENFKLNDNTVMKANGYEEARDKFRSWIKSLSTSEALQFRNSLALWVEIVSSHVFQDGSNYDAVTYMTAIAGDGTHF